MPDERSFSPRLVGDRFNDHSIPLEVLKDLAVLEELLLELARSEWLKDNPGRQRAPRGFSDGARLSLVRVGEGSAVAEIQPRFDGEDLFPEAITYFHRAWETLTAAIADASKPTPSFGFLPEPLVGYFNRLGRSLKPGEAMEFPLASGTAPRLTPSARRTILLSSPNLKTYTEEATIWGTVPEVDQENCTFELKLLGERRIKAPLPSEHAEAILTAVNGYSKGTRLRIKGIGVKNRAGRLLAIESIEQAFLLDPLDVPSRLDEFRGLERGWLDGHGVPPDEAGLTWLASAFTGHFLDNMPLPYTYPTESGGIRFEWLIDVIEASLEVDLGSKTGWWHSLSHDSDEHTEEELDLTGPGGWDRLKELLAASTGGAR